MTDNNTSPACPGSTSKKGSRIGITGASGTIGRLLTDGLADDYELALFDRKPLPKIGQRTLFSLLDLTDREAVRGQFDGLQVVIHLAADPGPRSSWDSILPNNITATYNLFEEAIAAGVTKIIFASSCHTQHGSSRGSAVNALNPAFQETGTRMKVSDPPNPDSLYGVSKLFGEQLGQYHATEHDLQFVGLRIGWVFAADDPTIQSGLASESYARAVFLSHRDCLGIFRRAIEIDVPYVLAYGTSDNDWNIFDLTETKRTFGFHPQDNAEIRFA